jgi:hypothetical protein
MVTAAVVEAPVLLVVDMMVEQDLLLLSLELL